MRNTYNKFFVQIGDGGYNHLIYWDKETNVQGQMTIDNDLSCEIFMKIKFMQLEIQLVER